MLMDLFMAGLLAIQDYVATHVLTCLMPAFLLAGAMVAFHQPGRRSCSHLGAKANKAKSFSLASIASFFVAACSCTVIPVSAGLYFSGAAVGVAFIILWVAPSANILSLIYTGNILGPEIVVARVVASLAMAFVVGWVMTVVFRNEVREDTCRRISEAGRRDHLPATADPALFSILVLPAVAQLHRTDGALLAEGDHLGDRHARARSPTR